MFPTELDNAKVLYYTPPDDYGAIEYPNRLEQMGNPSALFCYISVGIWSINIF